MIRYTLKCDQNHSFESWFKSADAYSALRDAGHVSCAICGSTAVEKALMAPRVTTSRKKAAPIPEPEPATTPAPASTAAPEPSPADIENAIQEMRRNVEENSEYVGMEFASEARAMHDGDAPERAIYGEAKPEEARKLIEDGVPVAPLPFIPRRKTN